MFDEQLRGEGTMPHQIKLEVPTNFDFGAGEAQGAANEFGIAPAMQTAAAMPPLPRPGGA